MGFALPPAHAAQRNDPASAKAKAHARAKARKALSRAVRRNPRVVLQRGFIKKAQAADYALPITVRLRKRTDDSGGLEAADDELGVSYDTSVFAWPLGAGFQPPPEQTVNLDGSFTLAIDFGADTSGYGTPGVLETTQGAGVSLAASAFAISDFDPATSPACTQPALQTGPVTLTSAGAAHGIIDLFNQRIRGTLRVHAAFNAERFDCDHATATPWTLPVNAGAMPPIPFSFDGGFRVSPAFTADGRVRFGVMNVDATATPQTSTFAFLNTCTVGGAASPAASPFCTAPDLQAFPARLAAKKLTAELLIGGGA